MRKLVLFWLFSIFCLSAIAQSASDKTVPLFFEKVYLHTDRDVYEQGEDIWFKAYVVNAQDNTPINYSHNLYVELISPGSKIVKRETIRLEDGLGNGDFKLTDTILPGHYRLRAYTNWMRNFGDNFIFEKPVTVLNAQTASAATTASNINKKSTTATYSSALAITTVPTIRFFPEGGSLVEGISSIVGVKAEDGYGKGIPAKGSIISSSGDTISRFSCDSLGMGLLTLLPVKGNTYRAAVDLAGGLPNQVRHDVFQLPAALGKGLTLQVKQTDSVIHAIINSSDSLLSSATLVVKHGGKTHLSKQLQLPNRQTAIKIPTVSLSEGISVITLYDHQSKPECERLVYVHHSNNANKVTIVTDKKSYRPKEQVNLNIQAPPHTSLSLAAVDARAVPVQPENIVSYLNLQSEVRGNIEHPDRYFDTTNVNRFKQLDQLLLTQGWRDFIWRRLEDTTLKLNYEPEQGIAVTGRVRRVVADKPFPGVYVTLHAPKAVDEKFFDAVTDSAGKFGIYGLKFYGYQYLYLNARNYSSKSKGKSNSGGWLQVDSLGRDTLPIRPAKSSPLTDSTFTVNPLLKLRIPPSHQLKEVKISAAKSYTIPPENHTISMAEQKDYGNVLQYLLYAIPEAHTRDGLCGTILIDNNIRKPRIINVSGSYTDHSPMELSTCQSDFLQLPMSKVLKLTIYRWYEWPADDFYLRLRVSLVLRPGSLKVKDFFDDTMADMVGYYRAKEFYKPRPENPGDIDLRTNTIYWEPNITIDRTGKAAVGFSNTAQTGKVRLIVEGITDTGTPLATNTDYVVK